MIELIMQVRKWVPSELKPDVKLANPNLFNVLALYYHGEDSTIVTQALIKELFTLAGDEFQKLLTAKSTSMPESVIKVYRGQTQLEESKAQVNQEQAKDKGTYQSIKKTRYYRGVPIV